MRSPVLLLVFNRPEITRRVLQAIRSAQPSRLYIAADGPRKDHFGDIDRCKDVRCIIDEIDWPCEVHTFFRESNKGCKLAGVSAMDWFFSHESEGMIFEDDILAEPTFFRFCDEMLERYRTDTRISMISGCNLISSIFSADESYFFTRIPIIYGWATWKRVWEHFDVVMTEWPTWRERGGLRELSEGDIAFESHWENNLNAAHEGLSDSWEYQWHFTCWRLRGLSVSPGVNLIRNLGFGADATHTNCAEPDYFIASTHKPISFPLEHPIAIHRDSRADALLDSIVFGINTPKISVQMVPSGSSFMPLAGLGSSKV